MSRPYCVGLTGGIGSGKSLVSDLFAGLGVEVVDTDVLSRRLTAPGGAAMKAIEAAFGPEFVLEDGSLDRERMRDVVYGDSAARRKLETILHPMIRRQAETAVSSSAAPYVLLVVPLLVETGAYGGLVDRIVVVDCEPEQQVNRLIARVGISAETARRILAAQAEPERRLAVADDVIDNREGPEKARAQVARLHQAYLAAARRRGGAAGCREGS